MNLTYVDLFAGAGGWDLAANKLGLRGVGVEWDEHAVATRKAAGLPTIQGDVRENNREADILLASPPCQAFSVAGKGRGREQLENVLRAVAHIYNYGDPPYEEWDIADERILLVTEPYHWIVRALDHGKAFQYVALEQVPSVLPVWEAMAEYMRYEGYSVATGVVNSEQYGVPQARKRAILVAHLDGPVSLPEPTHSRYYPRNPTKLDEGVEKWVSMAEALSVSPGTVMRSNYGSGGEASARGERTANLPAFTVTSKVRCNKWIPGREPVSIQEAATLQTFPADYPWQGTKGAQFLQVGNAIPPLLAYHILKTLIGE